jgi:cyclophilin family peptidyl-prolyl cis-trans isomerase
MEFTFQRKTLIISLAVLAIFIVGLAVWKLNIFNPVTRNSNPMETRVEIVTNQGTIRAMLFTSEAPRTTANFLKYVNDGFYDGLIFHRVIDGFMIQGGGFFPGMTQKEATYPPVKNEAKSSELKNERGTLSMARTMDPDSATAQFFINTVDNSFLDPGANDPNGYAVFGKVYEGMDIVDKIGKVQTHTVGYYQDVPVEDVVIESIKVIS